MSLAEKSCVPCRGGAAPMSREQAEQMLEQVPGWALSDDGTRITREFKVKNFVEATDFVRWVGHASETADHHPDISFGWGYARVTFFTHKIKGLHENDFIMAARVNGIFEDYEEDQAVTD
jgi:4a-hydroxytetrahydrobiopterin dehydratase